MYTSNDRSPLRAFEASTRGGLAASETGVVVGPTGVGKSQLLIHLALARLLEDEQVLHISLEDSAPHIHNRYAEILDGVCKHGNLLGREREQALVRAERNRQILSMLDKQGVGEIRAALDFARDFMHMQPSLLVVEGLDAQDAQGLQVLRGLATERQLGVWISTSGPVETGDFDTVVELSPQDQKVELRVRKVHGRPLSEPSGLRLDPRTMLVGAEDSWDPNTAPASPSSDACTLYSGGAPGAEACFGENADRYDLSEVNFTFDGHKQARTDNSQLLSPRELAAGDVSLVYVSKRLGRSYSEGSMIRKVLQSLWHQVSRAGQVFVVGAIQSDGTVTGGTGWSVELARMWHKKLWVYDQEQRGWFHWSGERWVEGVPVIESQHFCGTGTRSLNEAGRKAIASLFDRSFGQR
ncbi:MAG: AAA family ATPase [Myxococcota bacterium]|nr:AAA family ATPase [Myxococcota bacterium]